MKFEGIIPPIITPFNKDRSVDHPHIDFGHGFDPHGLGAHIPADNRGQHDHIDQQGALDEKIVVSAHQLLVPILCLVAFIGHRMRYWIGHLHFCSSHHRVHSAGDDFIPF